MDQLENLYTTLHSIQIGIWGWEMFLSHQRLETEAQAYLRIPQKGPDARGLQHLFLSSVILDAGICFQLLQRRQTYAQ